jgi:hypothetical protein
MMVTDLTGLDGFPSWLASKPQHPELAAYGAAEQAISAVSNTRAWLESVADMEDIRFAGIACWLLEAASLEAAADQASSTEGPEARAFLEAARGVLLSTTAQYFLEAGRSREEQAREVARLTKVLRGLERNLISSKNRAVGRKLSTWLAENRVRINSPQNAAELGLRVLLRVSAWEKSLRDAREYFGPPSVNSDDTPTVWVEESGRGDIHEFSVLVYPLFSYAKVLLQGTWTSAKGRVSTLEWVEVHGGSGRYLVGHRLPNATDPAYLNSLRAAALHLFDSSLAQKFSFEGLKHVNGCRGLVVAEHGSEEESRPHLVYCKVYRRFPGDSRELEAYVEVLVEGGVGNLFIPTLGRGNGVSALVLRAEIVGAEPVWIPPDARVELRNQMLEERGYGVPSDPLISKVLKPYTRYTHVADVLLRGPDRLVKLPFLAVHRIYAKRGGPPDYAREVPFVLTPVVDGWGQLTTDGPTRWSDDEWPDEEVEFELVGLVPLIAVTSAEVAL